MRKGVLLLCTVLILLACNKENNRSALISRDCTGTYIRYNHKDYMVCNLEKTNTFSDGASVVVTFKQINECNGSAKDQIVCLMAREHEGWVEILSIK